MKTRLSILLAPWLAACCASAHAACDSGLAERLHAKLHPGQPLDHALAVCEPWRGKPRHSIVVLPLQHATPGADADGARELDLDVLVVQQPDNGNSERTSILSRLFEAGVLGGGTRRIVEIRVDPARYQLAAQTQAFGLRILRRDDTQASSSSESLSLYLPQGAHLHKLLDGLELNMDRAEGDGDCGGFHTRRGHLSALQGNGEGYASLLLRRSERSGVGMMRDGECVMQQKPVIYKQITLHFDGQRYPLPSAP